MIANAESSFWEQTSRQESSQETVPLNADQPFSMFSLPVRTASASAQKDRQLGSTLPRTAAEEVGTVREVSSSVFAVELA